ncbi:hypothetical protein BO71DRAFT_365040 [Aspergillus ellipticus CBS 707.79]|uniref:Uncharacterized protein n=1 Tax=Aspergillus ellipticus CBS 707.79 TaxID=1448320 RepID=A0A319CVJ6_9EURO|nr:hypothetical protein BO71DRAFT_365040 [Aspergillus ellipticus CBS 707.79]
MSHDNRHQETGHFGRVPISAETVGEFYLTALNTIEERYHKIPSIVELDLRFKDSSGAVRRTIPFVMNRTERTSPQEWKTTFGMIVNTMSASPSFAGLSLEVQLDFFI